MAPKLSKKHVLLVNLSGRGDKDVESVLRYDAEHRGDEDPAARAEIHPAERGWSQTRKKGDLE